MYIGILCAVVTGCGGAVLGVDWWVLKGRYRYSQKYHYNHLTTETASEDIFPYPITTTFMQLFGCHLFLCALSSFTRLASPILTDAGLGVCIAPSHSAHEPPPTSSKYRRPKYVPRFLHRYTRLSTGIAGAGIFEFDRAVVKAIYPLAAVYALTLLLSNIAYAGTSIRIYTMIRIGIVPLTAIFTVMINRTWPSYSIILIALSGALGLLITCIMPTMAASPIVVAAGILSSISAAAFPELLVNTYAIILAGQVEADIGRITRLSTDLYHTSPITPTDTRATYQLFHHLSILSLMMLLPIVVLSGEVQTILRDYQHLGEWWPWFLLSLSALGTFGSLVGTVLLAKATSPLTVNYMSVPLYTVIIVVLAKFMLEIYVWVGVGTVVVSSALFWRERIREGRREKD